MSNEALARNTDPQTSHDAAAIVKVNHMELEILRALGTYQISGLTGSDIAVLRNIPRDSVSPRMPRLVMAGLVIDSLERKPPYIGVQKTRRRTKQIVWKITATGLEIYSSKKPDVSQSEPA